MFDDNHGSPTSMDVARDYLAVVTSANIVRILKVAGREAKPHAGPGKQRRGAGGAGGHTLTQVTA